MRDDFKSVLTETGIEDCAALGCWEAHDEQVDAESCWSPCGKQICVPTNTDGGLPDSYESIQIMRSSLLPNDSPGYCFASLAVREVECRLSIGVKAMREDGPAFGHGKFRLGCSESKNACGRQFTCTCTP
ncbi:MAG: hypothetical protein JNM17_11035 [Archangium sp.]|nr:hypothetical protein [Archangium sp.]